MGEIEVDRILGRGIDPGNGRHPRSDRLVLGRRAQTDDGNRDHQHDEGQTGQQLSPRRGGQVDDVPHRRQVGFRQIADIGRGGGRVTFLLRPNGTPGPGPGRGLQWRWRPDPPGLVAGGPTFGRGAAGGVTGGCHNAVVTPSLSAGAASCRALTHITLSDDPTPE